MTTKDAVRAQVWRAVDGQVEWPVCARVWRAMGAQVWGAVHGHVRRAVDAQVVRGEWPADGPRGGLSS